MELIGFVAGRVDDAQRGALNSRPVLYKYLLETDVHDVLAKASKEVTGCVNLYRLVFRVLVIFT